MRLFEDSWAASKRRSGTLNSGKRVRCMPTTGNIPHIPRKIKPFIVNGTVTTSKRCID